LGSNDPILSPAFWGLVAGLMFFGKAFASFEKMKYVFLDLLDSV
jgi:hypothetical protein